MIVLSCILFAILFMDHTSGEPLSEIVQFLNISSVDGRPFEELAKDCGYKAERHTVITDDGYILTLFRIPGDKTKPVLLVHGFLDTSDTFLIRKNTSLAITLAVAGYDVWCLNYRGNRYSRKHISLNPDIDPRFWEFSFQEIGYYDIPANIDYILRKTGQSQLSTIGHSEGTTSHFVLGSTRPEYSDKIKVFLALAPICYLTNAGEPINALIHVGQLVNKLLKAIAYNELGGYYSILKAFINALCSQGQPSYEFCVLTVTFSICGEDRENFEPEFLPIGIGHYPAGSSRQTLSHFSQVGISGVFAKYDYGTVKNLLVYKSATPPRYDLSKVKFGVTLIGAKNDKLSSLIDVNRLKSELPNVVDYHVVEFDKFNHLDHIWGKNAHQILYPYVLQVLSKYN